jgi:hypothetical protein
LRYLACADLGFNYYGLAENSSANTTKDVKPANPTIPEHRRYWESTDFTITKVMIWFLQRILICKLNHNSGTGNLPYVVLNL